VSDFAAGGTTITITGFDFAGVTAVTFGTVPAKSFQLNPDDTITAVVPTWSAALSSPTTVQVRVQTAAGKRGIVSQDQFTFIPNGAVPTITDLGATSGSTTGGQLVTIHGTNFTRVTGVSFGNTPAALYYVMSPTTIAALAPTAAAGAYNVSVTTPAGTSAPSSAAQFTAVAPASSSSSSSSSASSSSSPPANNPTYVVGAGFTPGANIAKAGVGTSGLLSSYTIPDPPSLPTMNPVATDNYNATTKVATWSYTDSGTVVNAPQKTTTTRADGSTITTFRSDTVTFTVSRGGTSGPTIATTASGHFVRTDAVASYQLISYPDGTYGLHTDVQTTLATWDSQATSGGTTTYTVDTQVSDSFSDSELGSTTAAGTDHVQQGDRGTSTSHTHTVTTVSGGVITVTYTNTSQGQDQYWSTDAATTLENTENDRLNGNDLWANESSGTYQHNADGTYTAMNMGSASGSGTGLYGVKGTVISPVFQRATDFATGYDALIDVGSDDDSGNVNYSVYSKGTANRYADGTITSTDEHKDSLQEKDDDQSDDNGVWGIHESSPDGSSIDGTGGFGSFVEDQSTEADGDEGNSSSAALGADELKGNVDDTLPYNSFGQGQLVLTAVAPTGAVSTITIGNQVSDRGKSKTHDESDDHETVPQEVNGVVPTTGAKDDTKFDDSASNKGKASDRQSIRIETHGNVGANDAVDFEEELTLEDQDDYQAQDDDPGEEIDTPAGDEEEDTAIGHSESHPKTVITDKIVRASETITHADGSTDTIESHGTTTDTINADETDDSTDQHGAKAPDAGTGAGGLLGSSPAANESDTDHITDDAKSKATDKTEGQREYKVTHTFPVGAGVFTVFEFLNSGGQDFQTVADEEDAAEDTAGAAVAGSAGTANGAQATSSASAATSSSSSSGASTAPVAGASGYDKLDLHDSDEGGGQADSGGFANLNLTDPVTGLQMKLLSSGTGKDKYHADSGDKLEDKSAFGSSGAGPEEFAAKSNSEDDDEFESHGDIDSSVAGSPAPGTEVVLSSTLRTNDNGNSADNSHDKAPSRGNDSGGGEFKTHDDTGVGGRSAAQISKTVNTDDGHGNAVEATAESRGRGTTGGANNQDGHGGDSFADAGGALTALNGADTENNNGQIESNGQGSERWGTLLHMVDPVTGMDVSLEVNNQDGQKGTGRDTGSVTDEIRSVLGTTANAPTITTTNTESGSEDVESNITNFQHLKLKISVQGTDAEGEQVDLTETTTFDEWGLGHGTDELSIIPDGSGTDAAEAKSKVGIQTSDRVTGTVRKIDSTTGIKTTTTYNDFDGAFGNGTRTDTDTATLATNGTTTEHPTNSEKESVTSWWNDHDTVTKTNPDGTAVGAPVTEDRVGNDTQITVDGVTTDLGQTTLPASTTSSTAPTVNAAVVAGPTRNGVSASGGDTILILGSGFTSDSTVSIGGTGSVPTLVLSSTEILAFTPAHAVGSASLIVTNAGGASPSTTTNQLQYQSDSENGNSTNSSTSSSNTSNANTAPSVTAVMVAGSPTAQASTAGGDIVVIIGTGFSSDTKVSFGTTPAQQDHVVSPAEIVTISPIRSAGTTDLSVSNGRGSSPKATADKVTVCNSEEAESGGISNSQGANGNAGPQKPEMSPSEAEKISAIKAKLEKVNAELKKNAYSQHIKNQLRWEKEHLERKLDSHNALDTNAIVNSELKKWQANADQAEYNRAVYGPYVPLAILGIVLAGPAVEVGAPIVVTATANASAALEASAAKLAASPVVAAALNNPPVRDAMENFVEGAAGSDGDLVNMIENGLLSAATNHAVNNPPSFRLDSARPSGRLQIRFQDQGADPFANLAPPVSGAANFSRERFPGAAHLQNSQGVIKLQDDLRSPVAPITPRTAKYGDLAAELRGTGEQANHLNQNAAFRSIIPEEEGLANALRGNAFTEPGTPHFEFHRSLEGFWNQYRPNGSLFGKTPTNAQYGQALQQALEAGGLSPTQAAELAAQAARQRAAFGLLDDALVPRIPGRLPLRKP
ncbi:MAG: IPT/TIG domain-containing protein, partial [Planctomycetes bacterium]|nr:IPT/TIG domain-containing protein [Planctomycetota bacterium]